MRTIKILSVFLIIGICFSFVSCSGFRRSKHNTTLAENDNIDLSGVSPMDIENVLYKKVKSEILKWNEDGIYAISFFVYSNEAYSYRGFSNVSMWDISYNTESDCEGAGSLDEERWNYAFWRQNTTPIIDVDLPNPYTDLLFDWYAANGIDNIGYEDENDMYDENMMYIGKGPVGLYELLGVAADIASRLQTEGIIKEHFGKPIPIIVHGLEYAWFDIEATQKANPNDEAETFLKAMKSLGFC